MITSDRTGGIHRLQAGVGGQAGTPRHTDPHPSRRPVDHGEDGVVETEYDGQVEMMDTEGS